MNIVIWHGSTSIEAFHSLLPFYQISADIQDWNFNFKNYNFSNIDKTEGDLLIIIRKYQGRKETYKDDIAELKNIRARFNKVVYFDDSANASHIAFDIFDYIDQYWKRSVLKKSDHYFNNLYGGSLYSDFYHKNYNIIDDVFYSNRNAEKDHFKKIKLAWNLGIGAYPTIDNNFTNRNYPFLRRALTATSLFGNNKVLVSFTNAYLEGMRSKLSKEINIKGKDRVISARFEYSPYTKTVGYQRKHAKEIIQNGKFFVNGPKINQWEFINEINHSLATFSPFGWGEICYRDFESILAGSILVKPSMNHIETWPNIYSEDEYISIGWNLEDLHNAELILDRAILFNENLNKLRERYLDSLMLFNQRATDLIRDVFKS